MKQTKDDFKKFIKENRGVLFYIATQSCSVGEALEPKVKNLLSEKYPKLVYRFMDMNQSPELLASLQVFTEPTILLFVEEKEFLRKSRHIAIQDLDRSIERLYELAFEY